MCVVSLALSMLSTEPAFAQRQGGFLSGLFGNNQNNRTQQAANSAQRRANRSVQTALNFFGFDVGSADGIFGRKTRAGISAFQTFMGYEATGSLTHEQQRFLLSSFNEINPIDEALALKISLGLVSTQDLLKGLSEGETVVADTPEDTVPAGPTSMRSLCVNIGADGPLELVKAQFCNLRQLAIEQGDVLLETSLTSTSIEPVIGECQNFTANMRPQISELATATSTTLISDMDLLFRRSGAAPEKLLRQAETCLGLAYQHDDAEAALAALLVLSGLKDAVYTELTGYHLALGLGIETADMPRAQGWMEAAIAAQPEGNVSLTAQSGAQRTNVLVDVITILATPE